MLDSPRSAVARDNKTAVASCYGPDGLDFESHLGRDFPHPSKPALEPSSLLYNTYQVLPGVNAAGALR